MTVMPETGAFDATVNSRRSISRTLRFEVFKRDKFTCQYCGAKAPDVVLNVDHIHPVVKGGGNDILNLVTACEACNGGKGARLIDDRSAMERQRPRLEALEARREQLRMLVEWRDELQRIDDEYVFAIVRRCEKHGGGGFCINETGKQNILRWLKRYDAGELLKAVDESFNIYLKWKGDRPCMDAVERAFLKVPNVALMIRNSKSKPYLRRLLYIQGILRKRFDDKYGRYLTALEEMIQEWGATEDQLESAARAASDWDDFNNRVFMSMEVLL